jgi:S-(hydroxymethyl)glutathione dehydrogenase/alcohol dehydrogenase
MGHEGSGVVTQVGAEVTSLSEGDHVVLSSVSPCHACRGCRSGHEARCARMASVVRPQGVLLDGTSRLSTGTGPVHHFLGVSSFAEEAVVAATAAIKIRADAPLDVAALAGGGLAGGIGAVTNTARVEPGATVVVIGCGGVGLAIVQGARLAGVARIVAIDRRPEKIALARRLGATDAIEAADGIHGILPEGADYAFDAVGTQDTAELAVRTLGVGGTAVLVGVPDPEAIIGLSPRTLIARDQRLLGSCYGGIRPSTDIPALIDRYMDGLIALDPLVTSVKALEQADEALQELAAGTALRTLLVP